VNLPDWYARAVLGVGSEAKPYEGPVLLPQPDQELGESRSGTDAEQKDSGGKRVEGPGVTYFLCTKNSSHSGDYIVRGHAFGFVDY
jgi:hypothetical protein